MWFFEDTYNDLLASVSKVKYFKLLKYPSIHWVKERSVLDMPCSNIMVERAVKKR